MRNQLLKLLKSQGSNHYLRSRIRTLLQNTMSSLPMKTDLLKTSIERMQDAETLLICENCGSTCIRTVWSPGLNSMPVEQATKLVMDISELFRSAKIGDLNCRDSKKKKSSST